MFRSCFVFSRGVPGGMSEVGSIGLFMFFILFAVIAGLRIFKSLRTLENWEQAKQTHPKDAAVAILGME